MSVSLVLHHYDIPLARPYIWSKGIHNRTWSIIVEAKIAESRGYGEIAYDPAWESLNEADFHRISGSIRLWYETCGDALFQAVLASDLSSVSVLLDQLLAVDYRVRCGVSSALFQALAQIQGKSIHELLSSQKRKEIPINCLISLRGGEAVDSACFRLTQEIERYTVLGITTVKCKGTADVSYDVGILKLLTAAYPECSFRLDPNGEWTPSEVVQHSDLLSELSLEYIEEPFSDPFAYKMLKENGVRIPIAFDHWGVTEADLAKAVERYTPVAVVIKCQVVGGPDKGACMVHIAENMGLKAVVTGSLETLVGLAVAAEVAACCSQLSASGILLWEYFNPNSHLAPPILGGMVPLPLVKSSPELPHRWLVGSVTI